MKAAYVVKVSKPVNTFFFICGDNNRTIDCVSAAIRSNWKLCTNYSNPLFYISTLIELELKSMVTANIL